MSRGLPPTGSCEAFNFTVLTDETRASGDRFVRCMTEDDELQVNFSSARDGEPLADGFVGLHLGLEHFGINSTDVEADVERLSALGAELDGRSAQRARRPEGGLHAHAERHPRRTDAAAETVATRSGRPAGPAPGHDPPREELECVA